MANTPFKFLDSYTSDDRDIFFGRETEIEELYYKILDGNLLIVYGSSGTGKTSLIQCGLAEKFEETDWMPIVVRRAKNINDSLKKTLQNLALVPISDKQSLVQHIKSVYLDYFKPIYLLFDQFEELFIFGSDEEIEKFVTDLQAALTAELSCKFIFVIRGEYLENIARFEEKIPDFFNNRMRVERMTRKNAMRVITEPSKLFNINVTEDFAGNVLERLGSNKATVELTYLQVYLDKLYKKAIAINPQHPMFNEDLLQRGGQIDDVLSEFLDEQIAKNQSPENALAILKSFVSGQGTKRQMSADEVVDFTRALGKNLSNDIVEADLRQFVDLRILKDKDDNDKFELRHDALAAKIYEQISSGEKEMLEAREFLINRFSDFQRRSTLLGDSDLHYIAPFENKLFLNDEQKQFIEKSKRAVRRKRFRRRNIAVGICLGLIIILSGFTIFAMQQRDVALVAKKLAETQSQMAVEQKKIADQKTQEAINQKVLTQSLNETLDSTLKEVVSAKQYAEVQSQMAANQTKIAEQQAIKAQEQEHLATVQKSMAEKEKKAAEENSREAQLQRQKADSAQKEASRLRLLTLGQALAGNSLQLRENKQLGALLAYQSYKFWNENGGNPMDPQIYSALYENLKNVNSDFKPIVIPTQNNIQSISLSNSGKNILALNGDGSLINYTGSNYSSQNAIRIPGNHLGLDRGYLSANGKFAITAYNDNSIIFFNIEKGNASPRLHGHTGFVRSAAFSSDGSVYATGGRDSTVIIWRENAISKKIRFNDHIRAICISPDNTTMAVGCEDGGMYLLNINSSDKKLIGNSEARIQSAAFGRQGNLSGFGTSNSMINLFRGTSLYKTIPDNTASIDFLAIDENLGVLVSASSNRIIHIYSLSDLSLKPIVIKDIISPIVSLVLSADGKILICCEDNNIRKFDIKPEHLQSLLFTSINRNFSTDEWNTYMGRDVPYQKIKPNLSE